MGTPRLIQHVTGDYDVRRAQEAVDRAFRQLATMVPFLDGTLLDAEGDPPVEGVAFTGGTPRDIAHKLGRRARGFIVVGDFGANGSVILHDDTNSNELTIRLTSSSTCRVKIWVW